MRSYPHKIIVIGAGVAGLSVAIRLAVKGYEVDVFERNEYPGGKLSHFNQDGYHFDEGPSLFTQPGNIEELFQLAGENIRDYFWYDSVDIACRYFFENGKVVDAFTNAELFASEMNEKLGEDGNQLVHYLKRSANIYDKIGKIFTDHSLHKRKTWLNKRILGALSATRPQYLFSTLNQVNAAHFKTPEAVQIFNRFATYNGSDPYKAPGMLSLIPHLELNQGVFYPHGGMISITNALYQLALKKGIKFHFGEEVERIIHHDRKIHGVVVKGANHYASRVISNMDVYFTYKNLLGDQIKASTILRQERSSSALIFYWGMKRPFDQLKLHNIFFSNNYRNEFYHLFRLKDLYDDPTIYINITSKFDPSHAPAGNENWFVMINAPANDGQDWNVLQSTARRNIISKLNRLLQEDIEPLIETESVLSPTDIELRTASYMGSLYGTSSNSRMAAFIRHPNFSKQVKGLYFVGGSVHPGGGIPLCMKSAKIVDELIPAV